MSWNSVLKWQKDLATNYCRVKQTSGNGVYSKDADS